MTFCAINPIYLKNKNALEIKDNKRFIVKTLLHDVARP